MADIDNDGDLDLFFQGGGTEQRLFRNDIVGTGSLSFTNVTSSMLPSPTGLSLAWSAAWGDYDGDGRIDVFVGQSNTAAGAAGDLLKNNGAGFSNVSSTTINDPNFHQNVAWSDIDNNGRLDLIIGMEGPEKHQIYLQDSSGVFAPATLAQGIQGGPGPNNKSYGMAIGDYDNDGDRDIYISTCATFTIRDSFFKNMLTGKWKQYAELRGYRRR